MYSILTIADQTYFTFLRILLNSIKDKCDQSKIHTIYVIDAGFTEEQLTYIQNAFKNVTIVSTNINGKFSGGVWGEDWNRIVKSKTAYLYDIVSKSSEPIMMVDSDMFVIKDLYSLITMGGDIQVCVRPNNNVKYIGSYFVSINHEKSLSFIKDWQLTTLSKINGAPESPSLVETIDKYKQILNIHEFEQHIVNVLEPKYLREDTHIIHFKGSSLPTDIGILYKTRIEDRGWLPYVKNYLLYV